MKIASEDQEEIIKVTAIDILSSEDIDYKGMDKEEVLQKAVLSVLATYKHITDQEDLSVTDKHAVIVSMISKLVIENSL